MPDNRGMLKWLWVSVLVVLLDQFSKVVAERALDDGSVVDLLPVLDLRLAYNTGAAFSLFENAGGWQQILFSAIGIVVSGFIVWYLRRLKRSQWLLALGMALILGGAMGNLYDRLTMGKVVDFIHVFWQNHHFPIFNLADSAITAGAALLIIDAIFFEARRHGQKG
ncbi:MAG: signal peptidase II [Gammaproteobacteria bacterium]|nr:MAG: signal peptidase II [Gammaproteobacteria bacterium]